MKMDFDFSKGAVHPVAITLANIKQSIDFIIEYPDITLQANLSKKILDLRAELVSVEK